MHSYLTYLSDFLHCAKQIIQLPGIILLATSKHGRANGCYQKGLWRCLHGRNKLARIWSDIWKNWLKNSFSAWMRSSNLVLKINDNILCSDNAYSLLIYNVHKLIIPPVPALNVPDSVKCLIFNVSWNFIDRKVLNIRFSNQLCCFSMGSAFLVSSAIFQVNRIIQLLDSHWQRGTHSAGWVPVSKRSFRVEYESVSSRHSGELSKGITSFKTLDSQFCFQMMSISSTVQYIDLNFASLSWY